MQTAARISSVAFGLILANVCAAQGANSNDATIAERGRACKAITRTEERLACYDQIFSVGEDALYNAAPSVAAIEEESLFDERWELDTRFKRGTFTVSPYKPIVILPVFYSSNPNKAPTSPGAGNTVPRSVDLKNTEVKFQLSMKTKLWEDVIGDFSDLWIGYTQSSRWQLYAPDISRPFRETDYEPEAILAFRTNYSLAGWKGRLFSLSLTHQSNGRTEPLSRSWNRVIATIGVERPGWSVTFRPWVRLSEDPADDDNPDIEDFVGRADLTVLRRWREHEISVMLRHSLRGGDRSHGAVEANWSFPLHGNLKGHLQVFDGYGESLIDYNHRATYFGVGVSLIEWTSR
jgi:phospholipase A1/A2